MNEHWKIYEEAKRANEKAEKCGFLLRLGGEYIDVLAQKEPYESGALIASAKTFGGILDFFSGYEQKTFELNHGGEIK